MDTLSKWVLWAAGLGFFAFGLWFVIDPIGPLQMAGVTVSGSMAAIEFRAFYGGLELALGLFLMLCAYRPAWRQTGLVLVFLAHCGLAAARLLALAIDPQFSTFIAVALVWEIGFAALSGACLALNKPAH